MNNKLTMALYSFSLIAITTVVCYFIFTVPPAVATQENPFPAQPLIPQSLSYVPDLTEADVEKNNLICKTIAQEMITGSDGITRPDKTDLNCQGHVTVETIEHGQWIKGTPIDCPDQVKSHVNFEWRREIKVIQKCDTCGDEFHSTRFQEEDACLLI